MDIKKQDKKQKRRVFRHLSRRLFLIAAAAVVFITTYALILPAITVEESVFAGMAGVDMPDRAEAETAADPQSEVHVGVPNEPAPDETITGLADEPSEPLTNPTGDSFVGEAAPEAPSIEEQPPQPPVNQVFTEALGNIFVNVEAEEGTFPAGTVMQLSVPSDQLVSEAAGEAAVLGAVDIAFYNNGTKIQPIKPVRITFTSESLVGTTAPAVIHVADSGYSEFIPQAPVDFRPEPDQYVIDALSFSTYILIDRSPAPPSGETPAAPETPVDPEIPADPTAPADTETPTAPVDPLEEQLPPNEEQQIPPADPVDPLVQSGAQIPDDNTDYYPPEGDIKVPEIIDQAPLPQDPSQEPADPQIDESAEPLMPGEEEPSDPEAFYPGAVMEAPYEGAPNNLVYPERPMLSAMQQTPEEPQMVMRSFALPALAGAYDVMPLVDPPAEPAGPTTTKMVTPNNNGTYKIRLDILGKVEQQTTVTKANVIVILDTSGSMDNRIAPGSPTTRLAAAKQAIEAIAGTLLGKNSLDPNNPDIVEMALIRFDTDASVWIPPETVLANFTARLDSPELAADGGTNWEDALQTVSSVNFGAGDTDPTYVIFVSDGNPTFRNTADNAENLPRNDNPNWSYWDWLDFRRDNIYYNSDGVYGLGSDNHNSDYWSPTSMQRCYNNTVDEAVALVASGMEFYGIGAYGNADWVSHLVIHAYGGNPQTDPPHENYFDATDTDGLQAALNAIADAIVNNLGFSNVVVDDTVPDMATIGAQVLGGVGGFKYYKTPVGQEPLIPWDTAPAAIVTESNTVQWSLGTGTLEDGVKYTLEFDVWPSQECYDLIADLNNGRKQLSDLTPIQQAQILVIDGTPPTYSLKTNTYLSVSYEYNGETGQDTLNAGNSAMGIAATSVSMKKLWSNELDEAEEDQVVVQLLRDGHPYFTGTNPVPGIADGILLNNANDWVKTGVYIAPGIIAVDENGSYEAIEPGHEYSMVEAPEYSYLWEIRSDVYRPMVINRVLTMLKLLKAGETLPVGAIAYTIDDKQYYTTPDGETLLFGTNYRKSNLNLTKDVIDPTADPDALFEYTITVNDPGSQDGYVWFSVNEDGNFLMPGELTYSSNVTPEIKNGAETGYYYVPNGTAFTVKMRAGANLRVLNLTSTSTYKIVESDMPQEFELANIELIEYFGNTDQIVDPPTTIPTITPETNTIEGTIGTPNNRYQVVYTNRLRTAPDISILKVNQNATPLAGATLQVLEGIDEVANFVTTDTAKVITGLKYGALYTLKELAAPAGYIILNNEIYFKIVHDEGIVLCDAEGNVKTDYTNAEVTGADNLTLQVSNTPGTALPTTGGTGTKAFTLMGLTVMISSALVWAYHERRKRKGGVVD